MAARVRLDKLVVDLDLAESRHQAQALIRSGAVLVDDVPRDKPGAQVNPSAIATNMKATPISAK